MRALKIWLALLGVTVAYGVVLDQVTIRVSPEYFLVGHVRVLETESLTHVALFWGVAATLPGAIALAFLTMTAARFGRTRDPLELTDIAKWLLCLPPVVFAIALAAGLTGYMMHELHALPFPEVLVSRVAEEARGRFVAVWAAHLASYVAFAMGGAGVAFLIWRAREVSSRA